MQDSDDTRIAATIRDKIKEAQTELLDLGTRNRLIHTSFNRATGSLIPIVDELSKELFRLIWRERKSMNFLPGAPTRRASSQPNGGVAETASQAVVWVPAEIRDVTESQRHSDRYLQTILTPEGLESRLLAMYRDAKTLEEDQGVSVLFLALGFLRWFEDDHSDVERLAPLILVPVDLLRADAKTPIKLVLRDGELEENLSLQELLRREHSIELPKFPDDEDWLPPTYFAEAAHAIRNKTRWTIEPNRIALGFYSFTKLLLFKDLEEGAWPEKAVLVGNPLFASILGRVTRDEPALFGDSEDLDDRFAPQDLPYVLDADASQVEVVEECRTGRSMVVWGPPGTGKSQTIANMIATAVADGKTVLFMAEKMAALDVVRRRLNAAGLGELCLELHSRKSNKKSLVESVWRSFDLGHVREPTEDPLLALTKVRDALNVEVRALHSRYGPAKRTAHQILGAMVRARQGGGPVPEFEMKEATGWTKPEIEARRDAVAALAADTQRYGRRAALGWRGVRTEGLTPADLERLSARLLAVVELIGEIAGQMNEAGELLNGEFETKSLGVGLDLAEALRHLATAPPERECLASAALRKDLARAGRLVETGKHFQALRRSFDSQITETAWLASLADARQQIAARGKSPFRFFNSAYRDAVASLRGLVKGALPKGHAERIALLDSILDGQRALQTVVDEAEFGRQAFGPAWVGETSNFDALGEVVTWLEQATGSLSRWRLGEAAQRVEDFQRVGTLGVTLQENANGLRAQLAALEAKLDLDPAEAPTNDEWSSFDFHSIVSRLSSWASDPEGYASWFFVKRHDEHCRELGLTPIADRLSNGTLEPAEALSVFEFVVAEAQWKSATRAAPILNEMDGARRSDSIARFRELEAVRRQLAAQSILARHGSSMPKSAAAGGEIGILREEANKKRRLRSVRRIISDAGRAVQKIKPVFLMSPLSVAQFVAPGALEFDLLLIDEASQIRPEDALGAIGRAKQLIVVGDDRQLPPTSFFDKRVQDQEDESDDDEEIDQQMAGARPRDMESILTLCDSTMPRRALQWHYRSKHPSLINVSNVEFYRGSLKLAPSPDTERTGRGMVLERVPGIYIPGGRRYDTSGGRPSSNPEEAAAIAEAVIAHARRKLSGATTLTLMVAALSVNQRDTILDEIDKLRRRYPEVEPFFAEGGSEPFDVKNLENVQGDERDIVLVSVGYGPLKRHGKLHSMSFGPVNREGGARRLNVLFTRARERCVIFCSFDPADIDLERSSAEGVRILRRFLYMAKGEQVGGPEETGGAHESDFEEAVADTIRDMGYRVEAQVGSAGFRIDLAVRHPEQGGRFMLGVECDGATYHSARWARERDRIREQILVDNGWRLHRIWSTDWFKRREAEVEHLRESLKVAALVPPSTPTKPAELAQGPISVERDLFPRPDASFKAPCYRKANVSVQKSNYQPHEYPSRLMAELVADIVEQEGPVHEEEVARRVAEAWGLQRAGSRIQAAALKGLRDAKRLQRVADESHFWAGQDAPKRASPRSRREVDSATLRKPEYLPPREIEAAVLEVVRGGVGVSHEDAVVEVSRLFGFDRAGQLIQSVVMCAVESLIRSGEIRDHDGILTIA
jgi:very-short-patch-repair endonuclease